MGPNPGISDAALIRRSRRNSRAFDEPLMRHAADELERAGTASPLSPDLELLRVELARAFERDLARGAARRRRRMFVAVAMATIASATTSISIASDSLRGSIERAAHGVTSVLTRDRDATAADEARGELVLELRDGSNRSLPIKTEGATP